MKAEKKYKYITIKKSDYYALYHGKPVYEITNNKTGDYLAMLTYYKPFAAYVFSSCENKVFGANCLRDVLDFMEALK